MSKITPTVGRIVYYYEAKASTGLAGAPTVVITGPLAATVTAVHGETCVNVAVNNADGAGAFGRTSIRLLQPGEHRPELGQWVEWMPYQIKQAETAPALAQLAAANPVLGDAARPRNPSVGQAINQAAAYQSAGSVTTDRVLSKEEHDLHREIRLVAEALEGGCGVTAARQRLFRVIAS